MPLAGSRVALKPALLERGAGPSRRVQYARRMKLSLRLSGLLTMAIALSTGCAHMSRRRMECPQRQDPREREICEAISHEIKFFYTGRHALLLLEFQMPGGVAPRLYCELHIQPADLPALQSLVRSSDSRLSGTAQSLQELLQGRDQPLDSTYNPDNPNYLLKHGCPGAGGYVKGASDVR